MARKKKNKNLQTFNVYPFLADYGINVPLQKKQNGGDQKIPPALSADYNFLNFGDCKGGGCAGNPYFDSSLQGFVGAEGNDLDDAMLQLGAKGLLGTFNKSGLGLHGYGEAGIQTPLNQASSGDVNPQPFYKAGVSTGYTGAPIQIGDANYSGLGIEGFGEYDSNTGVNVGGNLSYGPLNLRGGYNVNTKSPFFGGGVNINFARGGQLRKAQNGGVETSVEIDKNVTPRIELTGNLGETDFDFSTCYREKGALICNGQVVIGAEGDPNLTTTETIIPGEQETIVHDSIDMDTGQPMGNTVIQHPDQVIKNRNFSFTNPVTNLGLRTNVGYQSPGGIYGNVQGEGGLRTSDFTNFNPYLKGDLSLGYAGDNWNAELLGRYDSNEGFSGGVEGSYGPGFINALYNPETNSPQFTAGLRIPFAKGGSLPAYQEAGTTTENVNQENLTGFEYQRQLNELRDKQVNASLGAGPAFANSNLFNLMNLGTGIKNFVTDAQMGFPNAINPATGQEYSDFTFKDITIKNPTGENRILNTKVLQEYMDGNKSDRKKIDQDELWLKPNEVQASAFNELMDYRQETYPNMFSNSSMDLDGNINYDQITVPNPNYDEVLFEQTGDPQYGPTIVEDFDIEKHGTEFDKAEANLGDYNAKSFVSDDEGNFDESNIVFTTYKDGALTEEAYDPEKNYSDHTTTTNVQDDINEQFETENQRFGGTLRFQNGGDNDFKNIKEASKVYADNWGIKNKQALNILNQMNYNVGDTIMSSSMTGPRGDSMLRSENEFNVYSYMTDLYPEIIGSDGQFNMDLMNQKMQEHGYKDEFGNIPNYKRYNIGDLNLHLGKLSKTPMNTGGALRRFLQNGGTPVDTDFTNIDANDDGMPDYLDPTNVQEPFIGPVMPPLVNFPNTPDGEQGNPFNTGTGPTDMVDADNENISDFVDADGGDGTNVAVVDQPGQPYGPNLPPGEGNPFNTGTGDETEVNNDLGINVSYGDTFGQKLANMSEEFVKTSGFSNVASSFVQNIGEPTIDFLSGMKTGFDNWAKEQRALEKGDESMDIVPTIEASRSAKGDREFRTGDVKPWTQTQEEIYGQLAQLGGQPVNPQEGPDYSMLLQYIPSQSGARFDEMYLQKQMNDGGQIVDVDLELLKELMAAGADIQIL